LNDNEKYDEENLYKKERIIYEIENEINYELTNYIYFCFYYNTYS
jgi:hypothetical protein